MLKFRLGLGFDGGFVGEILDDSTPGGGIFDIWTAICKWGMWTPGLSGA